MIRTVPDGYYVRYRHERVITGGVVEPRGGVTRAEVRDSDGGIAAIGHAKCSRWDNYSKTIGRAISLGRALKAMETV